MGLSDFRLSENLSLTVLNSRWRVENQFLRTKVFLLLVLLTACSQDTESDYSGEVKSLDFRVAADSLNQLPVVEVQDEVLKDAISAALQRIEDDPNDATALRYLAMLYDANGYDHAAIDVYRKSLTVQIHDLESNYLLARQYHLGGLLMAAKHYAEIAAKISEKYGPVHMLLGSIYLDEGNYTLAQHSYDSALREGIGPAASVALAQVLLKQHQVQQSNELLMELATKTNHPMVYRLLGQSWQLLGDSRKAKEALAKGQDAKTPWYDDPIRETMEDLAIGIRQEIKRAQTLLASNQTERGITLLKEQVQTQPFNFNVQYQLGQAYLQIGNSNIAEGYLQRAIELEPTHYPSYLLLAAISQEREDNSRAEVYLSTVVDIFPALHIAHQELGFVRLKLNDLAGALSSFESAIEHDSVAPNVYYTAGVIHGQQGNCMNAIQYFEDTISLDKSHLKALLGLATCYEDQLNNEKALTYRREAARIQALQEAHISSQSNPDL